MRSCFSPISLHTSFCATPRLNGCAASISALRRRRCACEMWRRGVEVDRRSVPAALLDARDGNRQLRAGADEHRHVEDAVLLRADELLAVVEQHALVERVDHGELGHRAGVGDLGDREPARQRLVERDVGRDGIAGGEERRDHDAAVLDRVAELEGEGGGRCHVVLLSVDGESSGPRTGLTDVRAVGLRRCA